MLMMTIRSNIKGLFALLVSFIFPIAHAGFLEMPDTTDVPAFERDSMLEDLDIPPVRDRDPDPSAGPRLNIKEFRLQGLVEYPHLGITREALIKRVESIRFDIMKEGELKDSGYTESEIGEISDMLAQIEKETEGRHVGALEVQKLVFLIREQRRKRGVTLGMIETVADTITNFYREKGFILAKAYIPEQQVRDGIVTLTLLLGELGEVKVVNSKRISEAIVARTFKTDMDKPVTNKKVEESLYLVNDIPGVTAQGFFEPGTQVGDTRLNVNIIEEDRHAFNLRFDNHGSENTSEERVFFEYILQNPTSIGDELRFNLLSSVTDDSTLYGAVRYNTFLFNPRWRGSIGVSSNEFISRPIISDTSSVVTNFSGDSLVADASVSYVFKRSRIRNYTMSLGVSNIDTQLDTFLIPDDGSASSSANTAISELDEAVLNVSLSFDFDILAQRARRLYAGHIEIVHTDNAPVASGDFGGGTDQESASLFKFDVSMLSFWKLPVVKSETRLLFRSSGQFAGRGMNSVNQFTASGPTVARGFEVNEIFIDDGIYFGVDWIFKSPKFGGAKIRGEPISTAIQPYLFFDYAIGTAFAINPTDIDIDKRFSDIGFGFKLNFGSIKGDLSFAQPLESSDGIDRTDGDIVEEDDDIRVYFDLLFSF